MYRPYTGARFERVQSREMAARAWSRKPSIFRRIINFFTGALDD